MELTVVDWNLGHASRKRSYKHQAAFLTGVGADLLLLQEVNAECFHALRRHLDDAYWSRPHPVRTGLDPYGCAIFGKQRTSTPLSVSSLSDSDIDRIDGASTRSKRARNLALFAHVQASGMDLTVASVHIWNASGGKEYRRKRKMIDAVAEMMRRQEGPMVVGMDANGPKDDRLKVSENVYWGQRTKRDRGEYLLHKPGRGHNLTDAYRKYLHRNAAVKRQVAEKHPSGPLAVSYLRGRGERRIRCRYDIIFLSSDLIPEGVEYREDIREKGLSDHAPVVARISWDSRLGQVEPL